VKYGNMSRIGKKPITIPQNVEIRIDGQKIFIKGLKGELQREIRPEIKIELKEGKIFVSPQKETPKDPAFLGKRAVPMGQAKKIKALWGLTRTLISNMVKGVVDGYEKKLEVQGIGYKASLEGEDLVLNIGFSHPVRIKKIEGIKFSVEKNIINISGIDKEIVGQVSAQVRRVKPPEPYKGKGIRYLGEAVRRKDGKKVITTGA